MAGVAVGQQQRHGDVTFGLANGLTVSVSSGDITHLSGGAAVAGEDAKFRGRGGVAKALLGAGGRGYKEARKQMIDIVRARKLPGPVHSCSAGPPLGFGYVFHAVVTGHGNRLSMRVHLKNVYLRVALLAEENNVASVVTPLLGTGPTNLTSVDEALQAALDGLSQVRPEVLRTVIIVDSRRGRARDIEEKLRQTPGVRVSVDGRGPEDGPSHTGNPGPSGSEAGRPPGGFRQGPMHGGPSRGSSSPSAAGHDGPQPPRPAAGGGGGGGGMDVPAGDERLPTDTPGGAMSGAERREEEIREGGAGVLDAPCPGRTAELEDSDSGPSLPEPEEGVESHQEDLGLQDDRGEHETSPSLESEEGSDRGASGGPRSEDSEESDCSTDDSQKVKMWSSTRLSS